MKVSVNQDLCVGCGMCVNMCPDTFQFNENNKVETISNKNEECSKKAADSCPVSAISVEK